MTKLLHLDIETTGLDPEIHDVWEIAVIVIDDNGVNDYVWKVRPDLKHADPNALKIGGYYDRARFTGREEGPEEVAATLAILLNNAVVIGSNPAFDQAFLTRWLRKHGQAWAAHYRTIDVATLGWGRLLATDPEWADHVPPRAHDISRAHGIDPDDYARHTALGDCKWSKALYEAISGRGC